MFAFANMRAIRDMSWRLNVGGSSGIGARRSTHQLCVVSAVEELVLGIEHACGLCFLGPHNKHHGVGKASLRVLTGRS